MPHFMQDGTPISGNIHVGIQKDSYQKQRENFAILKCRVDEVIYIDDARNSTKGTSNEQTEYILTIIGGPELGNRIFNAISVVPLGGVYNSGEIIHDELIEGDTSGEFEKEPNKTHGAIVLLARVSGRKGNNVIVGCLKHPKSIQKIRKDDGRKILYQYNGLEIAVDKEGGITLTNMGGPRDKNGDPTNTEAEGASIGIDSDGMMSMKKGSQEISMDNEGQVSIKAAGENEMVMTSDGQPEMKSQITNIQSKQALNIKSQLTSIGQGGTPGARIGDICVGTGNEGRPVMSKIINGSFITMMGS